MSKEKIIAIKADSIKKRNVIAKKRHEELIDKQDAIVKAVGALYELINGKEALDTEKLAKQLSELSKDEQTANKIDELNKTIANTSKNSHKTLESLLKDIHKFKPVDNKPVLTAIKSLTNTISKQTHSQDADDFMPVRRVRKVGNRLQFDDDPMKVHVSGGSSFPSRLTENDRVNTNTVKQPEAQKITVDGSTTYIAYAPPGTLQSSAAWRVKRIVESGSNTVITWADGNANYDNVATDLTNLSYS